MSRLQRKIAGRLFDDAMYSQLKGSVVNPTEAQLKRIKSVNEGRIDMYHIYNNNKPSFLWFVEEFDNGDKRYREEQCDYINLNGIGYHRPHSLINAMDNYTLGRCCVYCDWNANYKGGKASVDVYIA